MVSSYSIGGQNVVDQFASVLKRRQVVGARLTALQTVHVLHQVISLSEFSTIEEAVEILKIVGQQLQQVQPKGALKELFLVPSLILGRIEHTVGNVVLKIIHVLKEEHLSNSTSRPSQSLSLANFVLMGQPRRQHRTVIKILGPSSKSEDNQITEHNGFGVFLKPVIIDAIQDVQYELESVYENVAKNARDHIHSDEIILTIGASRTVEAFLKSAGHHRKFTVIVSETSPSNYGHSMARSLSSAGISTFLVPDSSIYAMMSRVNKVVLGAHAILANGGFFATSGSTLVAMAARAHSTPVVVCAGQFKFTPKWTIYRNHGTLDFGDPSQVLGFQEKKFNDNVDIVNPTFDYVGPELVDAFITNDGDHPPSSVYRLIKESYGDMEL